MPDFGTSRPFVAYITSAPRACSLEAINSPEGETTVQLTEKYRPTKWEDVAGQGKAVAILKAASARGLGGRSIFISGKSGMGKTTLARIVAAEIAEGFGIIELDAGRLTIARLRDIEAEMQYRCFGEKSGRAYIVNECHGLKRDVIRELLVILERLPAHVVIIFTTTVDGKESLFEDNIDASPFLSRSLPVSLAQRDVTPALAARALEIAKAEGLDGGAELARVTKLLQEHRNNLRAVLQAIEAGALIG